MRSGWLHGVTAAGPMEDGYGVFGLGVDLVPVPDAEGPPWEVTFSFLSCFMFTAAERAGLLDLPLEASVRGPEMDMVWSTQGRLLIEPVPASVAPGWERPTFYSADATFEAWDLGDYTLVLNLARMNPLMCSFTVALASEADSLLHPDDS